MAHRDVEPMTSFDPKWEEVHKARTWGRFPSEHLIRFVFRNFKKPFKNYSALDIGCGAGAQTRFLADEGFATIGVDGSPAAIARCCGRPKYMVADAVALPFANAAFDLVVDVCCLQHLDYDDATMAVAEVARVLKPGGKFFSITARWSDTTEPDTPMRKLRHAEVGQLYNIAAFSPPVIEHEEYSDRLGSVIVAHWLISSGKR